MAGIPGQRLRLGDPADRQQEVDRSARGQGQSAKRKTGPVISTLIDLTSSMTGQ